MIDGSTRNQASELPTRAGTDYHAGLEPALSREIVQRDVGVAHDLSEQPSAERASRMNRHRRAPSIGMAEDHVTTALPDCNETVATEDGEHFLPRQGREARAHTATRTFVAPTSW
jgi:hypothetical protein